jgi:4-hydroxy-3-polyprenylbenzoate decarboxylase
MEPLKIIVAITGASGSIYAKLLLNELRAFRLRGQVAEVSVVFSEKAKEVWMHEIGSPPNTQPFSTFDNGDFNAPFASGSSLYDAMLICPCSMGTTGRLACGLSDTLISRAADVMLKERRRLILAIRETPLHLMHLAHLHTLTQAGAIIAPA